MNASRIVLLALASFVSIGSHASRAAPGDLYVTNSNFVRRYDGTSGAFLQQVSSTGISGASAIGLEFGPDGNLFGRGSNGWVFKYDFNTDMVSAFVSDVSAAGFAFEPVPEPSTLVLATLGLLSLYIIGMRRVS